jgi:hypothetical protein
MANQTEQRPTTAATKPFTHAGTPQRADLPAAAARPTPRWQPARVLTIAAGLLALVALVLAALGPVRPATAGSAAGRSTAAPEEASATLLSGYAGRDRVAREVASQVYAASLQVTNPTDVDQRYFLTVTFTGPGGRAMLQRDLTMDLSPGQLVVRQLFTRAERPETGVSVHLDVSRAPLAV